MAVRLQSICGHFVHSCSAEAKGISGWPEMVTPRDPTKPRPKLAIISTVWAYFTHPEHMGDCFLHGWPMSGAWHHPELDVVSVYADQQADQNPHDQTSETDIQRKRAEEFDFTLYADIAEALRCGGDRLAVDAVLIIGEHGAYPYNEYGQHLYPRYRFFKEVTRVFREDGRAVPVFNDKHLSWRFEWAAEMVQESRELNFPLMAGSSLPVAWRMPPIDMPLDAEVEAVMGLGYGGIDSYDFHSLETIQCMAERRKGGETGVRWVEASKGRAVCDALDAGIIDLFLLQGCLSRSQSINQAQGKGKGGFCKRFPTLAEIKDMVNAKGEPYMLRFEYTDGVQGTMLLLSGLVNDFTFAAKLKDEPAPLSTLMHLDNWGGHGDHGDGPGSNVQYSSILMSGAERMFLSGVAHVPIERTLLTGGLVEAGCQSLTLGKRMPTPHLSAITYAAPPLSNFGMD